MQNMSMGKLHSDRLKHFPNVNSLLKISLGLILFTIISTALVYAETISVGVEGTSYDVDYTATGVTLGSIEADTGFGSLLIAVDVTESPAFLEIVLNRDFYDSKFEGLDEEFFVLVDGEEGVFTDDATSESRTLRIELPFGTQDIEIIGNNFFGPSLDEETPEETDEPSSETDDDGSTELDQQSEQPTSIPQPTDPPAPTEIPATATETPEPTASFPTATTIQGANIRSGPSTAFEPPLGSIGANETRRILARKVTRLRFPSPIPTSRTTSSRRGCRMWKRGCANSLSPS